MQNPQLLIHIALGSLVLLVLIMLILLLRQRSHKKHQQQLYQLQLQQLQQQTAQLQSQNQQLKEQLHVLNQDYNQQQIEMTVLNTRLQETLSAASEKQRLLIQSEQRLTEQFENLANRIFVASGKRFEEQNRQSLDHLLSPLKEQLEGFKKQVQDSFSQEAKERHTLTHEIRSLQQLHAQMAEEALNLTNALKGNNKTQGNWGEVILNRILESSGLREGYEFETQASYHNEDGKRYQPDVIVHLPQGNDVIIDAKMTLVAYERYFNSQDEQQKELAMSEHLHSVRTHIKQLSEKEYHQLSGIKSLDYILMFIPVEPAFLAAIDRDPSLISEALKHNIMLVSPTTLLVALRTIHNLWRYEYQNRHAQDIAKRAGRLYDKMRGFIEDMENLGNTLERANKCYQDSMKKLSRGRGNVISQIEQFRELGIDIKKPISSSITTTACQEDEVKQQLDELPQEV